MANWENVESCVLCHIVGKRLVCVFFLLVDTFYGSELISLKKKGFQVFANTKTVTIIEVRKIL